MTQEEKAKAYDEALKKVKDMLSYKEVRHEDMEYIFPELKESEDERIRKELIDYINRLTVTPNNIDRYNSWIAWLEKQGEQKTTNKVEPKFHKDEWVVNNATLNLCHILRVEHGQYICDDCSFPITKENEYHLWTIQDAKDGDVLDANGAPFIYKKHDKDCVYFYCGVNLAGEFVEANEFDTWNNNNKVYPATKEQRDLLFAKMKEAGYTFDSEKKELKKISQRMISAEAKETLYDKPAWSEEDEHRAEDTIYFLDTAKKHYASSVELDACINWLKTIKQRIEGKQ